MSTIALFHSVLGVTPGIVEAAERLGSHGHHVQVVDQYDGKTFDDYQEADAFAKGIGYETLMANALDAVAGIHMPFTVAGFSNGGGMATYVASKRIEVNGALLFSGAIDPEMIGVDHWPAHVATQIHYTRGDPFRNDQWLTALEKLIRDSGARLDHYDYDGAGHLFTDASRPDEYQPGDAELLWTRALEFLDSIGS